MYPIELILTNQHDRQPRQSQIHNIDVDKQTVGPFCLSVPEELLTTASTSRSNRFRKQYLDYDNDDCGINKMAVKVLKIKHELNKKELEMPKEKRQRKPINYKE
ncbi:hypothetical protein RclHR1_12240007 [Rhizophagus clarus]|uniref:Uncharacterized protein n=1 Tax=Rhizophagus clarus TaxID=94130 RepID=A0A2Z6QLS0_9GLOM|nr:hypothetical protein RclHR1_12240007 [Rhizophagus clarus]